MSTFVDEQVPCPHCGRVTVRSVAAGLNATRMPALRQEILDDRFQRYDCPACGRGYHVDSPFIYIDFDARLWIAQYPRRWERGWVALEAEPLHTWRRTMVDFAPRIVREDAHDYTVRSVFGLVALRDKIACMAAGLDDAVLEVVKLDWMRGGDGAAMNPAVRPALSRVTYDELHFSVPPDADGNARELSLPRAAYDAITSGREEWARTLTLLSGGPYVDVGRIMIPGDAEL